MPGTAEVAGQGVIVLGRDRVELVVVAAGAGDRQAEERLRQHVDLVVDATHPLLAHVHRRVRPLAQEEESGAEDRLVRAVGGVPPGVFHEVARDVLDDEAVIGHVGVERPDDVIAIGVGADDVVVELVPGRLGVPHQVEPVPPPALAVVGRREQAIDDLLEGVRGAVGEEGVDLRDRRRQADQVERQAPEERPLVGVRGGLEALRLQAVEQEAIDGVPRPSRALDRRGFRRPDGLEAPVLRAFLEVECLGGRGLGLRGFAAGPGGAHLDPSGECGDLGGFELRLRRHLDEVAVVHRVDDEALARLARHDGRPIAPAFEHARARVEPQVALGLLRAVALLAAPDEEGADFLLEELGPGGVVGEGRGRGERQEGQQREGPRHGNASRPSGIRRRRPIPGPAASPRGGGRGPTRA